MTDQLPIEIKLYGDCSAKFLPFNTTVSPLLAIKGAKEVMEGVLSSKTTTASFLQPQIKKELQPREIFTINKKTFLFDKIIQINDL